MRPAILGISAYYHDSAAALLVDGRVVAAAQEERFTRKRHDPSFPIHACRFVLEASGVRFNELSAVAFYDKPFLKFERLLETYHAFAPSGLRSFAAAMPVWIKEKLFMRRLLAEHLRELGDAAHHVYFPEHHLSHAASAFYPSPFTEAAILTIDGVGEWATTTIGRGRGKDIEIFSELHFPHSIGLLYSAFTYYLGFTVNSGEYKLMGLAPYGNAASDRTKDFVRRTTSELVDIRKDGSILLNMRVLRLRHRSADGERAEMGAAVRHAAARSLRASSTQVHMDLALAIQQVTEEIVLRLVAHSAGAERMPSSRPWPAAWRSTAWRTERSSRPACSTTSGSSRLPATPVAPSERHMPCGTSTAAKSGRSIPAARTRWPARYLGPEFSSTQIAQIRRALRWEGAALRQRRRAGRRRGGAPRCRRGWRLVPGPHGVRTPCARQPQHHRRRAESRDAEATEPENQVPRRLQAVRAVGARGGRVVDTSSSIGRRRTCCWSRPSARTGSGRCHLTTRISRCTTGCIFVRSDLPAITHVDYSARIQTVSRATNPRYWMLIDAFKRLTGCGVLVNTSFNVRGEPIVCTPDEAYRCFMRTEMDFLVMGDYVFDKKDQPAFDEQGWRPSVD